MENTTSLFHYIKDEYLPDPKAIPDRIVKEVLLECGFQECPSCNAPLSPYYISKSRFLVTLRYDLWLQIQFKRCPNPACFLHQQAIRFHNPELEQVVLYDHRYAFDVILLMGHLIYQQHFTEQKVVTYLLEEHGIPISQPDVNHYKRIALAISEATLISNSETIRNTLAKLPVRVYVLDGTNSNFSKTLFIVREIFTGMVLGTALLTEHDKDTIKQFLDHIFAQFGSPDFLVGDGERGLISAARNFYPEIPFQYCHQHFLKNLGKALMEGPEKELNKRLKKTILN